MKKITLFILFFYTLISSASASVTMLKTRIVYLSDAKSETLKLKNNDNIPYIMQIWTDINNPDSTPTDADGPFVVQPTVFRIEPNTGRDANLIYTGGSLPQNKESLFYLNLVQVPPSNTSSGENELSFLIRHRIKIFYRPVSLASDVADIGKSITFSNITSSGIEIKNSSPYFLSLNSVNAIGQTGEKIELVPSMISPFSSEKLPIKKGKVTNFKQAKVIFSFINDLGGNVEHTYKYN